MLKTKRLILRPLKDSDYKSWVKTCSERLPPRNKFEKGPAPKEKLSRVQFKAWLKGSEKARQKDLLYILGIFDRLSGQYIGIVSFAVISRLRYQFANLGYEINNQFSGQGYATEAVKAALPFALKSYKLHRIEAGIEPDNLASLKIVEKVGMYSEGLRPRFFHDGKKWLDLLYFSSTSEDWGLKKYKPSIKTEIKDYF